MRLAEDYVEARGRFRDAAAAAGARLQQYEHPLTGPAGESLATDVATLGSPDAATRLLVISGTHGVEGFAGSMCQTRWLTEGVAVPDDVAIVLVHAINPYGFAWIRRVNEDNVDLNRNCIDFSAALPENSGYDALAPALVPPTWDPDTQQATASVLARVRRRARVRRAAGSGEQGPVPAPRRHLLRRHATGLVAADARGDRRGSRCPVRSAARTSTSTPGSGRSASVSSSRAIPMMRARIASTPGTATTRCRAKARPCRPT